MDDETEAHREARLQALWKQLDPKRSGYLDLPGLKNGLAVMQHPLKDAESLIKEMLTAADVDHDGKISYDEFRRFCNQTEKELWQLFRAIDRDHSGQLDKAELSAAFERAGLAVSNARVERFFDYIDKNHDGTIDFSEWRDFLLFLPTNSPGLKAVFSYYQTTARATAEGDVHMTEESVRGLGTALNFLRSSLFGAVSQIAHSGPARKRGPDTTVLLQAQGADASRAVFAGQQDADADDEVSDDDPYIPLKPARRKGELSDLNDALQQDDKVHLKLTDFIPELGYFVAGGLAGITSRTATAPLDRLKVYLIAQTDSASDALKAVKSGNPAQALSHSGRTLWRASQHLWAAGGVRSLFAGNGINILKVMPESGVKFAAYEASKKLVAKWEGHNDTRRIASWSLFTAGGVSGMVAQAVVYPLDTLKFRMQCETVPGGERGNALIISTAKKMWARNGIVGFYRGLPMGLVGMFPYSAIDLGVFETFKSYAIARNRRLHPELKHDEDALPGNFTMALMGGFSGAIGASAVYPINLLRTRLQSQGTSSHPRTYTGIVDVTRQTLAGEGVRGLFKGLTPNLLKVVPAVSITYVVYENCKRWLHLT